MSFLIKMALPDLVLQKGQIVELKLVINAKNHLRSGEESLRLKDVVLSAETT